jgi:hypothetical protein
MKSANSQRGAAGFVLLLILALLFAALLPAPLSHAMLQATRDRLSARALAQAKAALIGDASLQSAPDQAAFLRLPDIGLGVGNAPSEGSAAPNFSGNATDLSVIGKLPWRTLKLEPLRDGDNECLWYVVSGRFKNQPVTGALNWDTLGQLTLLDANGNVLVEHVAALLIAPGAALAQQDRSMSDAAYAQCGGNYDARNYLDPFDAADAVSGAVHYFSGAINGRVATTTAEKIFRLADGVRYNDAFLAVSSADLFLPLMRRADFAAQISALLDDDYFRTVTISGSKGTDGVNCNQLEAGNQTFCKNWKEMLLLVQPPAPTAVMIDGVPTSDCARVLLFGGSRVGGQVRDTVADKAQPANYLEGDNLMSFAVPVAVGNQFNGNSTFNPDQPEADLLRCLP